MISVMKRFFWILVLSYVQVVLSVAQPVTRILFIFDSSYSMQARWESGSRMDVAKRLLGELIDSLAQVKEARVEIALRLYGHSKGYPPQDCNDTRLVVPFGPDNHQRIKRVVQSLKPMGTTPIAIALERSVEDFPPCELCRNLIVLITDGIEECGGDPCQVSEQLQAKGIVIKPFVIGIGLDEMQRRAMECVGRYYDAGREEDFRRVLGLVISQALERTTFQLNLLDADQYPRESDVAFTVMDQKSSKIHYRMMHTLNSLGMPDTLSGDPLVTYRVVVHSIPQVELRDVQLSSAKHNILALPLQRGKLKVKTAKVIGYNDLKVVLRSEEGAILNLQDINTEARILVGKYRLEVLTHPPYFTDIDIKAGEVTTVEVPVAGMLSFQTVTSGYASVVDEKGQRILDLDEQATRHLIPLQPGRYSIVYRPKAARDLFFSVTRDFEIISGATTVVKLN